MNNLNDVSIKNQSVAKVMQVIECLAGKSAPQRLQDIANEIEMNPSTLLRFLLTLKNLGYVDQSAETSKYYLTMKICAIGNLVSSNVENRSIIRPYLQTVSDTLKESVCYAVERDMSVVYMDVIHGPVQSLKVSNKIGNQAPMHCTGIGKLLLLEHDISYIDRMIAQNGLRQFTENTIITKEDLLRELEEVRKRGYAYDNEECDLGVSCIAFPLHGYTGKIIGGMSVTGPTVRVKNLDTPKTINYLKRISGIISEKLGYLPTADEEIAM